MEHLKELGRFMFTEDNMHTHTPLHTHTKKTYTNKNICVNLPNEIMPVHKDKLFWCFYIIYKGVHEYELHLKDNFIIEKNFKIATAEQLQQFKSNFKQAKLKTSEIEDELVNQQQITIKGLHALCIVYSISIMHVVNANKTYCEFLYDKESVDDDIKKIEVILFNRMNNTCSVKLFENNNVENKENYIPKIRNSYWKVEKIKAPSAYSVKELHDICLCLDISIVSELGKKKTKQILYQDILSKI